MPPESLSVRERLFLLDLLPTVGPTAQELHSPPSKLFEKFKKENDNPLNTPKIVPRLEKQLLPRKHHRPCYPSTIRAVDPNACFDLEALPEEVVDVIFQHVFTDAMRCGDRRPCVALMQSNKMVQKRFMLASDSVVDSVGQRLHSFVDRGIFEKGDSAATAYIVLGVPASWLLYANSALELLQKKCDSNLSTAVVEARGREKRREVKAPSLWLHKSLRAN